MIPPHEYLGLSTDPALSLASVLRAWGPDADEIQHLVIAAETLADEPVHVSSRIDQIVLDGRSMAAAIETAVAEAGGFLIEPRHHVAPPILDGWMVAVLADQQRIAIEFAAEPHTRAALADRVDELRTNLDELYELAARHAIGDNDARIDETRGRLRHAERALTSATFTALTPQAVVAIDRLGAEAAGVGGPAAHRVLHNLRLEIDGVFLDRQQANAVFSLVAAGTPVEIAFASVTGNWQNVPGGDPAAYTDEQKRVVINLLGIELPTDLSAGDLVGIDELFGVLPEDVVAALFNVGVGYEFGGSLGLSTPGQLIVPVGGSIARQVGGEISVSEPQIGVGFTQTHTVEIIAALTGQISARAGKTPLSRAYKILNRLDRVPRALQDVLARSPLLRGLAKGLPFSISFARFAGTEIGYEATIDADQAAALDAGDASVLPDIFAPLDLATGNSVLIRGGAIEGTNFSLKYKLLYLNETITDFSGLGFGVTRLEGGRVAIYSGPIEAIERQTFLGLKFGVTAGFNNTTDVAFHDFAYAELDLTTSEGLAAYQEFITGGGVPSTATAPGVRPATIDVIDIDSEAGFQIGVGAFSAEWELNSSNVSQTVTTYEDGTSVFNNTRSYGDAQVQFEAPLLPDGSIDFDQSTFTLVVADVADHNIALLDVGFGDGPHDINAGEYRNQHVQLTYTAADIIELQKTAQDVVRRYAIDGDHYAAILEWPSPGDLIEVVAAADSPAEVLQAIDNAAAFSADNVIYQVGELGFELAYVDREWTDTRMPGTISYSPSD